MLLLSLFAAAQAGGIVLDALPTKTSVFTSPGVLVGFNPQPDPPRELFWADLSTSQRPQIGIADFSETTASLILGVAEGDGSVRSIVAPARECRASRDVTVYPIRSDVSLSGVCATGDLYLLATFSDGTEVALEVNIGVDGRSDPLSMVAVSPQPSPPGQAAFGLEVSWRERTEGDLSVTLTAEDTATGELISFQ